MMNEEELVLTTTDNPYNPKTEYEQWRAWDIDNGYNTEEYLSRIVSMNEKEFDVDDELVVMTLTNQAIQEILENDMLNVYVLV